MYHDPIIYVNRMPTVRIMDGVDKMIQYPGQIRQDSSQSRVTIRVSRLMHGNCGCYNT